ncbi:MAG TPA: glycosyltransferase family 1 protein [Gemmatimonadaceae bacterium]|nr:glycosyltransferase family 1 protein [Gemmatimonadaceae bacterium]
MSRPSGIGRHSQALMQSLERFAPNVTVRRVEHRGLAKLRPRVLRRALYLGWLASGIPGRLQRRTFDLVHFTNFHVAPRKPRGLRYASTIHDLVPFHAPETKSWQYGAYLRRSIEQALRVADVVFAASHAVRDEMAEHFRLNADCIRVVYVPPGIAPMPATDARAYVRRAWPAFGDAPFVLFVGALERRKNLVALVAAIAQLPIAHRDVHLVLAGRPGIGYEEISDAIGRATSASRRVHVLAQCTDADLRALYSTCAVFAFPSSYEGYGIPLLEAMVCGAPIVATEIPASVELTAGAAILVRQSAEALAEGLTRVLDSNALREELATAGRSRAAQFTSEQTARQLLEGYGAVLGAGR